jgi:hypothetical protein
MCQKGKSSAEEGPKRRATTMQKTTVNSDRRITAFLAMDRSNVGVVIVATVTHSHKSARDGREKEKK